VSIMFVTTPSTDSASQTEVILPEQEEQKNLVYVLLKKGEANDEQRGHPTTVRPTTTEARSLLHPVRQPTRSVCLCVQGFMLVARLDPTAKVSGLIVIGQL
jgi:hypothetical protein